MRKIFILLVFEVLFISCKFRTNTIKVTYLDNKIDTLNVGYRGRIYISSGFNLVDGNGNVVVRNIKSYSIIK